MKFNKETAKFIVLRTIGNFLVLFSLYGIGMTLGPAAYLEAKYRVNQIRNVRYEIAFKPSKAEPVEEVIVLPTPTTAVNTTFFGQITSGDKIEFLQPVSTEFGIVIPKIGANAPILPNVNAADSKVYLPALKQG